MCITESIASVRGCSECANLQIRNRYNADTFSEVRDACKLPLHHGWHCWTVRACHLNTSARGNRNLKVCADVQANDSRFCNAGVEFDLASLRPTYRLIWGSVGASNALAVAEGLGFDPLVIAEARKVCLIFLACIVLSACSAHRSYLCLGRASSCIVYVLSAGVPHILLEEQPCEHQSRITQLDTQHQSVSVSPWIVSLAYI